MAIYLPKRRNVIGDTLTKVAFMKMQQQYQLRQAEIREKNLLAREKLLAEWREMSQIKAEGRQERAEIRREERGVEIEKGKEKREAAQEAAARARRAAAKPKITPIKGTDSVLVFMNGKWVTVKRPKPTGGGKLTAREKKIKFWMDQGIPEARAAAAVDKLIHYEPSQLTGKVLVTNTVTGNSWVIDPESVEAKMGLGGGELPPDAPALPQRSGKTLWDVAGQGTGLGSAVKGAVNVAAGAFGGAPFPKVDTARKMIKTTSIRFSQNQRKNVRSETERREVEKTFGLFSRFYNSPALFRNNLRRLKNDLGNYLAKTEQSAENKRLTPKVRAGYRDEAEQLKDMIRQLGVPPEVTGDDDSNYQSLPSGAEYFYKGTLRKKK